MSFKSCTCACILLAHLTLTKIIETALCLNINIIQSTNRFHVAVRVLW